MHDTAALMGQAFLRCYGDPIPPPAAILDVGSLDINGTLRPAAPKGAKYVGIDLAPGPGVDIVVTESERFPFPTASFDLVISTSCLEHDPVFWLTFLQMARVVRPGGFIYISAPSNGPYHGHPGDCWRFYADAGKALAAWAVRNGLAIQLIETFMQEPITDVWIDNVMIFGKPPVPDRRRLSELKFKFSAAV